MRQDIETQINVYHSMTLKINIHESTVIEINQMNERVNGTILLSEEF